MTENKSVYVQDKKTLTSTVAYLLGINRLYFNLDPDGVILTKNAINHHDFESQMFESLQSVPECHTLRNLCKIRKELLYNYEQTSKLLIYDLKNIDNMPQYISSEDIDYLKQYDINIIKSNCKINIYITDINSLINQKLKSCSSIKNLFPTWINYDYIIELLVMPIPFTYSQSSDKKIAKQIALYKDNYDCYPYHMYINWYPIYPSPIGNVLITDRRLAIFLNKIHGITEEIDNSLFSDVSKEVSNQLDLYIKNADENGIVVLVDCENSDPYKLANTLTRLEKIAHDKIKRISLFDDASTLPVWSYIMNATSLPVNHQLVQRVNANKSLVDLKMTFEASREYYQNNIHSIVIASSDSDFWNIISSLPDANIIMLAEKDKIGQPMKDALTEHNIAYYYMDNFSSADIYNINQNILLTELKKSIDTYIKFNIYDEITTIIDKTKMNLNSNEYNNFIEKYVKKAKLTISDNGEIGIQL